MSKSFRVFFRLEGEQAEAFDKIANKPWVVARAVECYLSIGPTLQNLESRLEAIHEQLGRGMAPMPPKDEATADEDDMEKKLDTLIERTLGIH